MGGAALVVVLVSFYSSFSAAEELVARTESVPCRYVSRKPIEETPFTGLVREVPTGKSIAWLDNNASAKGRC